MGQKVNPVGIRLGIVKDWASRWYTKKSSDYAKLLLADIKVREFLEKKLGDAGVARIEIERLADRVKINIAVARPGVVYGQKGKSAETLRADVSKLMGGAPVHIAIEEIRKPELEAKLVARNIADQLKQRIMFRRAMKRAVSSALRAGALGVKICISGRLGGAEIARSEWHREGRVPLHTFRADIDYALGEAMTTYGVIGVKVWIFKGEKLGHKKVYSEAAVETTSGE